MFVLDSSVLIEVIEDLPRSEKVEDLLRGEPAVTTTICMHEVLAGADSDKRRFVLETLFSRMNVLEHTSEAARRGARLEQDLSKKGSKINTNDVLIAGICLSQNATLITLDHDFKKIPNLNVITLG